MTSLFRYIVIFSLFTQVILTGCASSNMLSEKEIVVQQKAIDALTAILFEYELDEQTSYEVNKDGFVNMTIDGLVPVKAYTKTITALRNHKDISGVLATQGGVEVCPLVQ